jgi:hypothetical protein
MKIVTLLAVTIFTLSATAGTKKHELNFEESITVKKVFMKKSLPTNLASLFKDRSEIKMATLR